MLPRRPLCRIFSLDSSMICGSLEMGTATSVVQTPMLGSPPVLAMTLHRASLRACHRSSFSCSDFANSKLTEPVFLASAWTWLICSLTELCVPANLKNSVGAFFHVFEVWPASLMHCICTSSRISMAAMGTPPPTTLKTQSAAARTVGNAHTATLVCCGLGMILRVASVTRPRVPSLPTNMRVRS